MSTFLTMSVEFKLDELSAEYQLQIVRFVNHSAKVDCVTREHLFQQLNKLEGMDCDKHVH